jgi:hypothetical protein
MPLKPGPIRHPSDPTREKDIPTTPAATLRSGPLTDNAVLEVVYDDKVIGYVFAYPNTGGEVSQMQRWILYEGHRTLPRNGTALRWPRTLTYPITSLSEWDAAAPRLWVDGSTYVMANVGSHDSVGTYTLPPDPIDVGPSPQIDDDIAGGAVRGALAVWLGEKPTGYAYGTAIIDGERGGKNAEFWLQLPDYQSPTATGASAMLLGESTTRGPFASAGEFASFASSIWVAGATYSLVSCVYLKSLRAKG